ncbi:hypothetical protein [Clostridiisalibacter paucivorans]|uniref:hypothetical protein n=1 Tax=Clostridiisalibacter paucivorans TaxID=408753 RepID=UPI0005510298|nr:hypothetical protein [Clostridiisalibacter paucivorans]
MLIYDFLFLFLGFFITFILMPNILVFLRKINFFEKNYNNILIPISTGFFLGLIESFLCVIHLIVLREMDIFIIIFIFGMVIIGIVGIIDDKFGNKKIKGIRNHILYFFKKGKISTGIAKAFVGVFFSTLISLFTTNNEITFVLNSIIVALSINYINLFDLRPGRSIKISILTLFVALIISQNKEYNFIAYSTLGIISAYLPFDLKGKAMLGDSGSNILGFILGTYFITIQPIYIKNIILFILILSNTMAEFFSFSTIINNNKVLKYLDDLGR